MNAPLPESILKAIESVTPTTNTASNMAAPS